MVCVADYFKAGAYFKDRVGLAVSVISWFIRHSLAAGKLREKQLKAYKEAISLSLPVSTSWTSLVGALETLISTKGALCSLVHESREILEELGPATASARATNCMVLDAVESAGFWRDVEVVLKDLKPIRVRRINAR